MGSEFDLWKQQEDFLEETSKDIIRSSKDDELITEIQHQIRLIQKNGFEPKFLHMNIRNYERLISYLNTDKSGYAPDKLFGLEIALWDIPIDYVMVKCSASKEWAYGEAVRKQ